MNIEKLNKTNYLRTNLVSENVDFTTHWILARVLSLPPPNKTCGIFSFISSAVIAQSAPCDLLSSPFFFFTSLYISVSAVCFVRKWHRIYTKWKHTYTYLSSSFIGSEFIPSNGIVPWSKKCAALNTVPSPPTAIIKSTSARCCLSNSTRFTHENATLFAFRTDNRLSTHSLCEWYRDSRRCHRSAFGAWPLNLSWCMY